MTQTPKPAREARAVDDKTAPLKSRIALGYLTVNGRVEPIFAPIQGFEHLFANTDVAARKRRRARSPTSDADGDCEASPVPKTFRIGDIASLQIFYATRFRELTMKPMRDIVTAWVKRLEPKRQKKFGPYQRYDLDPLSVRAKSTKPPWWPTEIPYVEPSHLKLERKSRLRQTCSCSLTVGRFGASSSRYHDDPPPY